MFSTVRGLNKDTALTLLNTERSRFNRIFFSLIAITYGYFGLLIILGLGLFVAGCLAILSGGIAYWLIVFGVSILSTVLPALYSAQKRPVESLVRDIDRKAYPELSHMVSELEREFDVKIQKISIDGQMNAQASFTSRYIFFKRGGVLRLGLPLLLALSHNQLKAVLAHEFGHISRRHGRITRWSYNTYYMLLRLKGKSMPNGVKKRIDFLISPFFAFIWPRLSVMQFALGRQFEFEVDKDAAQVVGLENMIDMLVLLEYFSFREAEFWKSLAVKNKTQELAPEGVYESLESYIAVPQDKVAAIAFIERSLFSQTNTYDTHPAFKDRVSALKNDVSFSQLATRIRATESFYKTALRDSSLVHEMSEKWRVVVEPGWKSNYAHFSEIAKGIDQDIEQLNAGNRSSEALLTIAGKVIDCYGYARAEVYVDEALALVPEDFAALYHKLRIVAERKDKKAALEIGDRITDARPVDRQFVLPVLMSLAISIADKDWFDQLRKEDEELMSKVREYFHTVSDVFKSDTFAKTTLDSEAIQRVIDLGKTCDDIQNIYVISKKISIFKDEYINLVIFKPHWFCFDKNRVCRLVIEKFQKASLGLGDSLLVPSSNKKYKNVLKAALKDPSSVVYTDIRRHIFPIIGKGLLVLGLVAFLVLALFVGSRSAYTDSYTGFSDTRVIMTNTYFDPVTKLSLTGPLGEWRIATPPNNEGWSTVRMQRALRSQDYKDISQFSTQPSKVLVATDISFVNIELSRYVFTSETPATEESNFNFHSSIRRSETSDLTKPNTLEDPHYITFHGHMAVKTVSAYKNNAFGTTGRSEIVTFIYGNKGYSFIFSAADPLFEMYKDEALKIIDSITIKE